MPLFEQRNRTRMSPLQRGERLFNFYDDSGSVGYDEFRATLNEWLSEIPDSERIKLATRMKSGGDLGFKTGTCELIVHSLLKRLQRDIVPHPEIKGSSGRPDFLATKQDEDPVYVEVTTINPPEQQDAEANREAPIYNVINSVKLPAGCILGYDLIRAGGNSPSLSGLVAEVESWTKASRDAAQKEPVRKRFSIDNWEIELELFATKSDKVYTDAIGVVSAGARWIAPHVDLKSALYRKTKKYGALNAPYLIAVADAKGQIFETEGAKETVTEAMLGDEVVRMQEGEAPQLARANNGFWKRREAPHNTHVSAVMLFPDTGLWTLRSASHQPILAINPWANHPLPDSLKVFPHFEAVENKWSFKDGKIVADVLGLPDPWPPEK